jgi:hypothetical protein
MGSNLKRNAICIPFWKKNNGGIITPQPFPTRGGEFHICHGFCAVLSTTSGIHKTNRPHTGTESITNNRNGLA